MKTKTSLYLMGVVGAAASAALTGYLASKPSLRKQLRDSESSGEAVKLLASNMKRDGTAFGTDIRKYLENPALHSKVRKAGRTVTSRLKKASRDVQKKAQQVREHVEAKTA